MQLHVLKDSAGHYGFTPNKPEADVELICTVGSVEDAKAVIDARLVREHGYCEFDIVIKSPSGPLVKLTIEGLSIIKFAASSELVRIVEDRFRGALAEVAPTAELEFCKL